MCRCAESLAKALLLLQNKETQAPSCVHLAPGEKERLQNRVTTVKLPGGAILGRGTLPCPPTSSKQVGQSAAVLSNEKSKPSSHIRSKTHSTSRPVAKLSAVVGGTPGVTCAFHGLGRTQSDSLLHPAPRSPARPGYMGHAAPRRRHLQVARKGCKLACLFVSPSPEPPVDRTKVLAVLQLLLKPCCPQLVG